MQSLKLRSMTDQSVVFVCSARDDSRSLVLTVVWAIYHIFLRERINFHFACTIRIRTHIAAVTISHHRRHAGYVCECVCVCANWSDWWKLSQKPATNINHHYHLCGWWKIRQLIQDKFEMKNMQMMCSRVSHGDEDKLFDWQTMTITMMAMDEENERQRQSTWQ